VSGRVGTTGVTLRDDGTAELIEVRSTSGVSTSGRGQRACTRTKKNVDGEAHWVLTDSPIALEITGIFQTADEFECWEESDEHDFGTEFSEKTREAITFSLSGGSIVGFSKEPEEDDYYGSRVSPGVAGLTVEEPDEDHDYGGLQVI
jgi:hypothetical protein